MDFSLDITAEFNDLKYAYSCELCRNVLTTPFILKSCNHELCKQCVALKQEMCLVCNKPRGQADYDSFTQIIVEGIENIEKIFPAIGGNDDEERGFKIAIIRSGMKRNSKGETPLHTSCKLGQFDKVEHLVLIGVDLNVTDNANWTPLHEAIESNNYDCVELLLRRGALANVPGDLYATPLHKAASLDSIDIAKLLLFYGADATCLDYMGKTAMEYSMSPEMTQLFSNPTPSKTNYLPTCFVDRTPIVYSNNNVSKENRHEMMKHKVKFVTSQEFQNKVDVTHFIHAGVEKFDVNVLMAIVKGSFIVDQKWIEAFLKYRNVISFEFIVDVYRDAVTKSVTNKMKRLPKLFDGVSFHILKHELVAVRDMKISKNELTSLIEAAGGKVVIRPPALRTVEDARNFPFHVEKGSALSMCCHYIIYSKNDPPKLLYQMKELRHKSSEWLIDCILNFRICE